jgi:hypothetical protein
MDWVDPIVNEAIGGLQSSNSHIDNQITALEFAKDKI